MMNYIMALAMAPAAANAATADDEDARGSWRTAAGLVVYRAFGKRRMNRPPNDAGPSQPKRTKVIHSLWLRFTHASTKPFFVY